MYSLNLLPPEIKQEINYARRNARIVKYLALSLSSFIIIIALFFGLALIIKNEQKIANLEKDSSKKILAQNQSIEAKANDLSQRLRLIKKLKNNRTDWPKIFTALSENTPTGVQLTSITLSTSSQKTRPKVTGLAKSDRDIVLFKDLLAKTDFFSYIDIENMAEASDPTGRNLSTKSFVMSFTLKTGVKK